MKRVTAERASRSSRTSRAVELAARPWISNEVQEDAPSSHRDEGEQDRNSIGSQRDRNETSDDSADSGEEGSHRPVERHQLHQRARHVDVCSITRFQRPTTAIAVPSAIAILSSTGRAQHDSTMANCRSFAISLLAEPRRSDFWRNATSAAWADGRSWINDKDRRGHRAP